MVFGTVVRRCSIGRIPLIKFRHGAITSVDRSTTQNLQQCSGVAIEDWQLPARYKRLPFTEEEIEFINRGGPA